MLPGSKAVPVLFDPDVERLAVMRDLVEVCRSGLEADFRGDLIAPPRHQVDFHNGNLIFTTGGTLDVVGFRAYETFPNSKQDQVVAVWNVGSGRLAGVVIGDRLGAYRTGAIGGVAVGSLAAPEATSCAVIGTGLQASTQLLGAASVRQLDRVWCFSRSERRRLLFARRMSDLIGVDVVAVGEARSAVAEAEIVLVATTSREPVIAPEDLRPDAHVSTVGPKFVSAHEVPGDLVTGAWRIASDSPQQLRSIGPSLIAADNGVLSRVEHLGGIERVDERRKGRTCFLSAGLAGTEVLVAAHLLSR